jgi:acyl-CoA thioesterase FadM
MEILLRHTIRQSDCDAMQHMSSKSHIALFETACYNLMLRVFNWTHENPGFEGFGWANLKQEIRYHRELRVDEDLEVRGRAIQIKRSILQSEFEIVNSRTGQTASVMKLSSCFLDLNERSIAKITEEMRQHFQSYLASNNVK